MAGAVRDPSIEHRRAPVDLSCEDAAMVCPSPGMAWMHAGTRLSSQRRGQFAFGEAHVIDWLRRDVDAGATGCFVALPGGSPEQYTVVPET
jgi:hypothetical protein